MRRIKIDRLKLITHIAALLPLALLIWDFWNGRLTANPIREIQLRTGKDALVLLILALACYPTNKFFGLHQVTRLRRTLGVYAFVYASLHFLNFVGLDFGFEPDLIYEGIFQKPYALVGFATFLILLPLAVTSTNGWQKRLGKNWKRLHQLIYLAAPLAVIHFLWGRLAKLTIGEPLVYGAIVIFLLLLRVPAIKRLAPSRSYRRPKTD